MKAVVLAGGHGTRLWPVTKNRAKPLLPIGKRPLIDYIVEEIENQADEVIISTNAKFADDFENYIEEYGRNARVVVEEQDSEEEKPGTIGAIIKLLEQERLDDDLLIVGGDNYFGFPFSELFEFIEQKDSLVNVVYDIDDREHAKQFGIVATEDSRIVGFEEKPEEPPSTLASTACYFFPRRHVSLFEEYEDHFRQTDVSEDEYLDEPGRLIEWAHDRVEMNAFKFSGEWHDVGTPKGYLEATEAVIDGKLIEGTVLDCKVGENVVVMEGAVLEDVSIENSIVFENAAIRDSEIKSSLIDSNAEIENVDLNGAIIGSHTTL